MTNTIEIPRDLLAASVSVPKNNDEFKAQVVVVERLRAMLAAPVVEKPQGGREVPFSSLCYGAKFTYTEGEAAVWVKVGHNVIAGWKAEHVATNWVAQPLCSFSEDDDDVSALVWLIDEGSPV